MTLEEIRELMEKATPRPWLTRSDIEIPYDAIFEANIIARRAYHQLREAGPELAALLVRAVEEILDLVRMCPACAGRGWFESSESAHAPECDGSCRNCPVEVQTQAECVHCSSACAFLRELGVEA